jgi:hypothetical protein
VIVKYLALAVLLVLSPFTLANDCSGKMKSAQSSSPADKVASVEVGKDSKQAETSKTPADTKKTSTN